MKKYFLLLTAVLLFTGCPGGKERNIDVAPRLTLIGPAEVFFNVDDIYIEYGYKAVDVDGNDVSHLVRRDASALNMGKEGSYQISYVAVDRRGVKSDAVYRTVNVGDAFAPEITVAGTNPMLVGLNSEFTAPAATAVAYDGTDLSDSVIVNAESVDTTKVGTYTVTYTVTDSSGVTGTASLYVYVLESDSPRIVFEGPGSTEDNPLMIQWIKGQSAEKAEEVFYSSLPSFRAYDLQDGDISYRVKVDENGLDAFYAAMVADPIDTAVKTLSLTVSDFEGNTPQPLPALYVVVAEDTEPPVIEITGQQPNAAGVYELEVDMWRNNTSDWYDLLDKMQVTLYDNSWKSIDASVDVPMDFPEKIPEYTDGTGEGATKIPMMKEVSIQLGDGEASDSLRAALEHDSGANLSIFDYTKPDSAVNYKKVTFYAKDNAGKDSSLTVTVLLTDKTPPVIQKRTPEVPFGITGSTDNEVPSAYQLSWKDNSGQTGSCTGLTLDKIENALVQGSYYVNFIAICGGLTSEEKNVKVRVKSPLFVSNGGNYMDNNLFKLSGLNYNFTNDKSSHDATDSGVSSESDGKMGYYAPVGWNKTNKSAYWYWGKVAFGNPVFKGSKTITQNVMTDEEAGNIICTNLIASYNNKTVGAYYVVGGRNANSTTIRGTAIELQANVTNQTYSTAAMLPGVSYQFGYKIALTGISNESYTPAPGYKVVLKSSKKSFAGDTDSIEASASPTKGQGNNYPARHLKALAGMTGNGTVNNWETFSATATVGGEAVTNYTITFTLTPSDDYTACEFGCLLTDLFLVPVKWKGKTDLDDPACTTITNYSYNIDTGKVEVE